MNNEVDGGGDPAPTYTYASTFTDGSSQRTDQDLNCQISQYDIDETSFGHSSCSNFQVLSLDRTRLPHVNTSEPQPLRHDYCHSNHEVSNLDETDALCASKDISPYEGLTRSHSESSFAEESTLGTTLANSLKLISTNNLPVADSPVECTQLPSSSPSPKSHPLLLEPQIPSDRDELQVQSDRDTSPHQEELHYPDKDSPAADALPPATPCRYSTSPQGTPRRYTTSPQGTPRRYTTSPQGTPRRYTTSPQATPRRYKTRSATSKGNTVSGRKKGRKSGGSESQAASPELAPDGSVTLFQCEICNKMFNRKQTLRQHFITHTDRFSCPYCKTRCKSKGDLRSHIQTHTKEKPFHCEVCKTNYTRESILKKHQTTQTHKKAVMALEKAPKTERASTSSRKGSNVSKVSLTVQSEIKTEAIACEKCEKKFSSNADLRKHKKVHSLKYKCKTCSRRCRTSALLELHRKCHEKHKPLICQFCALSFPNHFYLKEHMKCHNRSRMNAFYDLGWKMRRDQQKWKEETRYESQLGKPTGKSQKVARWSCHMCCKAYINKKSLENHEKMHHCHNCAICEKRYPTLSKLKMHMKLHGKPYKCDICESPFYNQFDFKEHVDKHHVADDDLKCKICYEEFECGPELESHMANHAPTMLFSGACLEESSIPVHSKHKKGATPGSGPFQLSDSEDSSEVKGEEETSAGSGVRTPDLHKLFNNNDFVELLSNVILDLSQASLADEDSDSDVELLTSIKDIVERDLVDPIDAADSADQNCIADSVIFTPEQIVEKHNHEFALHAQEDYEKNVFSCKLCECRYEDRHQLQQHLLGHVCEFCNLFFPAQADLHYHKEQHKLQGMTKVKDGAVCVESSLKDSLCSNASDSDQDEEIDGFLSEMENILDCRSHKAPTTVLQTLSHDEIIKANKKTFERYSCIDSSSSIFACTICKRKYARPTTLTRHFKTHVCPYCNQFFEDKADLLEHKYKHRKDPSSSNVEATGEKRKGPMSPMVSKVNRELFKKFSFIDSQHKINRCTLCSKNFVRRTVLTRHMKTHICSHCDKFYEDKYDLAKHVGTHRSDLYFSDGGNEDFADYEDEDERPYSGHPAVGERGKLVSIPSAFSTGLPHYTPTFHSQSGMSDENQTLTFIQIPATEGGQASATQMYTTTTPGGSTFQIISEPDSNPESFLVTPTNGAAVDPGKIITISQSQIVSEDNDDRRRLYECGECGKRFLKNGHLKSHMLIHSGDKPYACRLCGKSFSRSTTLRKHEKTHMKRCKICDSTFSYKYELDIHMEIHRTYAFYK